MCYSSENDEKDYGSGYLGRSAKGSAPLPLLGCPSSGHGGSRGGYSRGSSSQGYDQRQQNSGGINFSQQNGWGGDSNQEQDGASKRMFV